MSGRFLLLLMAFAGGALCRGGTIVGSIRALPPPGMPDAGASGGAYDSRRYKFVERIDYDHLRDFVVYVDQSVAAALAITSGSQSVKTTPAKTIQRDANFDPHVLPIAVGTAVRWPNEDDIFHNVFSMAEGNEFDLGYYKKDKVPIPEVIFNQPGKVDVYCAIHTKMHCIILVLPNPYFAMADEKGRYVIKDVPAGTYKLRGWHERLPTQAQEVVVPADGEVKVDFVLGVGRQPKP